MMVFMTSGSSMGLPSLSSVMVIAGSGVAGAGAGVDAGVSAPGCGLAVPGCAAGVSEQAARSRNSIAAANRSAIILVFICRVLLYSVVYVWFL
jgi:hypothetical protein